MNLLTKLFGNTHSSTPTAQLTAGEYKKRFVETNTPHLLVDVRTAAEFAEGHITGARNLPVQDVQHKMRELPTDKPVVLYCRSGNRSGMALQMLQAAGYTNVYNAGALHDLTKQGLPIH
jgi:rhodanese-related sulfurtransferase